MIVFSSHLARINRVYVITSFKSKLHKSCFLFDSKNYKKTDTLSKKNDAKSDKKNLREKFSKMSFISLSESTPKVSKEYKREKKLEDDKNDKEEVVKKRPSDYTPSFKIRFTAQASQDSNSRLKETDTKAKQDKSKKNFEENLEQSARKVAKLIEKDTNEQVKTTEAILGKVVNLSDIYKNKSKNIPNGFGEPTIDQMKKNESEFIKYLSKNSENLNNDEFNIKDDDVISQRKERTKINFWTDSPYKKFQSLTSGNGLSIFNEVKFLSRPSESPIWSMHYDQELKQAQEIPPLNGFDELIQLTDQGKIWTFPIDNEQDIDEADAQVPFHEHVFLDHYLEEFPQIEPIQHFMTLALNGLSQNSFLSLKEKTEIIEWYKDYFNDRIDIIKEALEAERLEASYRENVENK